MEVKRITVMGAGLMGRGIAQGAAMAGYQVYIVDVSQEILEAAMEVIRRHLARGVELGKVSEEVQATALQSLEPTTDRELACREADFVIEAVPEEITLKLEIFRFLDQMCPPSAILASNTSGLSITEMASNTRRPAQVIGLHFFNPVHLMRLVEVVHGLDTSQETLAASLAVVRRMGKETVQVNEYPGLVTSRINAMIGNEAFYMLQEGVASAPDIDKAIKLGLNHAMGPFESGDLVGLDTRLRVLENLYQTLGEKYRPCPLLVKYVKAGRLGRKSGRGVYDYTGTA